MAEQAQAKLDEAQKQFNKAGRRPQAGGPVTEYDKHGRPIADADARPRLRRPRRRPPPTTPGVAADRAAEPPAAGRRAGPDPSAPPARPAAAEDPNRAPKLTSGDPLAG